MLEGQPACLRQMRKPELSLLLGLTDLRKVSPGLLWLLPSRCTPLLSGNPAGLEAEQPCAQPKSSVRDFLRAPLLLESKLSLIPNHACYAHGDPTVARLAQRRQHLEGSQMQTYSWPARPNQPSPPPGHCVHQCPSCQARWLDCLFLSKSVFRQSPSGYSETECYQPGNRQLLFFFPFPPSESDLFRLSS